MEQVFITLRMDTSDQAPRGPGWYIQVMGDKNVMIAPTEIPQEAAQELGAAYQRALQTTPEEVPSVSVPQLIQSASGLIRQALEKQLRYAEEQAKKVEILRRKLALAPPRKDN